MESVILLTGTINPDGMSMTEITSTDLRKKQYISSIEYWLKIPEIRVIFVENSGYDFSQELLEYVRSRRIEFLSFNGNNYDKQIGKGLGELLCIEYALSHSSIIEDDTFIFKVTGRYKVLNFVTFLNFVKSNNKLEILSDLKLNLTFSDSRFFGFKKKFVKDYLSLQKHYLNDAKGFYFENALTKAALSAIADGYVFSAMPDLPRIDGYSGSLGKKFKSNYLHWMKHRIKYYLKYKSFGLGHMPDF